MRVCSGVDAVGAWRGWPGQGPRWVLRDLSSEPPPGLSPGETLCESQSCVKQAFRRPGPWGHSAGLAEAQAWPPERATRTVSGPAAPAQALEGSP